MFTSSSIFRASFVNLLKSAGRASATYCNSSISIQQAAMALSSSSRRASNSSWQLGQMEFCRTEMERNVAGKIVHPLPLLLDQPKVEVLLLLPDLCDCLFSLRACRDVLRHGFEVFFKLCPAIPKGAGKFRRNLFADLKRKVVRFQSGRCSFVYWYRRFLSLPVLLSIPRYKPVGCSISRSARRRGGHQPHTRRCRSRNPRGCTRGRKRLPRQRLAASTNNYG